MSQATVIGLLIAVIEFATLLYLAALGETIAEKAGVLNLGVEGTMAIGGVTAFWAGVQFENPWLALLVGIVAGALFCLIHAIVAVVMGADQVVSGLALTIGGLGLSAFIGQDLVVERAATKFGPLTFGPLSDIPWIGEILFSMTPITWMAIAMGIVAWFVLTRTRAGLILRAVGESASAADSSGASVVSSRVIAVMIGGALAGMSGAYLTLSLAAGWSEGTTAGRGWIAVALVIFGAWKPGRVAVGALLFGGLLALEPRLQTFGVDFSPILLSMLPYLITIAVLIAISVRSRHRPSVAPAAIGTAYRREDR